MQEDVLTRHNGVKLLYSEYDSLEQFAQRAAERDPHFATRYSTRYDFRHARSGAEALRLAKDGWTEQLPEALRIAESAVATIEKEHDVATFVPTWDVFGSDVDMGRFVTGEPECMIDYPLKPIVKAGKVITLCVPISVSGSLKTSTIIRRGQAIVALALALSAIGYATELWADWTGSVKPGGRGDLACARILVKGPNDVLDPERIMYAFAHPSMLRVLGFAWMHGMPGDWPSRMAVAEGAATSGGYGYPAAAVKNLPEGTIYLKEIHSDRDVPDADVQLLAYLRDLEIITD